MRYLGVIFLFLIFYSCSSLKKDNNCNSIFTESEFITQKRIIHFMDSVVLANTNESDIESAYLKYFENEKNKINETGFVTIFNLNFIEVEQFLRSLNREHLREYYTIRDTVYVKVAENKDSLVHDAFDKELEFNGKYMQLLSCLSDKNKFIASHVENLKAAGGFGTQFSETILSVDKFNLNNESERLVIAITLFSLNKSYKKE